jgi:hypothetical protein
LISLSAFQRSYSIFSTKDTRGRQSLSQSKQPRSAATATALPAPLRGKMANPIRDIHQYAFIESLLNLEPNIHQYAFIESLIIQTW